MEIKNLADEVIHTEPGDTLSGANLARTNLSGANLAGANLAGANLVGAYLARANLVGANLAGANLVVANLAGANLVVANLAGANLVGAYLARANLVGANLAGARGVLPLGSPDGWFSYGWLREGVLSIRVGCREKRLDEALEYWDRPEKTHRREVVAAVRYAEAVAKIRGWAV